MKFNFELDLYRFVLLNVRKRDSTKTLKKCLWRKHAHSQNVIRKKPVTLLWKKEKILDGQGI